MDGSQVTFETMVRSFLAFAAVTCLIAVPSGARAQRWNDPRTLELVERATARRAAQLADTALVDYRARAHGYLTFLAQIGAGFPEPPKIVKADELALVVFWRAPNLSKQFIEGRRDTLLLPTDIQYHRDHLGIVQNNFPSIIRIGEGDEVRDVPHPLSAGGLRDYDFSMGDSLELRLGPRTIEVYEVRVRPRDERAARVVGAVYIERESADLVRMTLGFTRAALLDKSLEDLSIVLESGLIEGRFWLPRRQEVEIRRTGTWLDYPVRTIIRGRWEICCYTINVGFSAESFAGPEIVRMARPPGGAPPANVFAGRILDSIPGDVRAVTDADVARIQNEARTLVRAQALARSRKPTLAGARFSDFVRFNRVEGLALGAGLGQRLADGVAVTAQGRYGVDDRRWKGRTELSLTRPTGAGVALVWSDDHQIAGDGRERSLAINSIAAQEFGSDYTDPYRSRGVELIGRLPVASGRASLRLAWFHDESLSIHAKPASGRFEPTLPVVPGRVTSATVRWEQPTVLAHGWEVRYSTEAGALGARPPLAPALTYGRGAISLYAQRSTGQVRTALELFAAGTGGGEGALIQHYVFLGGPVSAPGYDYHELAGRRGAYAHLELKTYVPFVSVPLGRFGRTPAHMEVAPFAHSAWIGAPSEVRESATGWRPSVGVSLRPFFELVSFQFARGLKQGRWTFSLDVTRDFWPIL